MDNSNYEQVSISKSEIEDEIPYLKEGLEVTVVMHGEKALTVSQAPQLPQRPTHLGCSAPHSSQTYTVLLFAIDF